MSRRPLRIGLIGAGFMGKCHAVAWSSVGPIFGDMAPPHLAILCDRTSELAERNASNLGFAAATDDWRKLIADPDVDVVSITTPTGTHREIALEALSAGKHVWCEKPMAGRLADAEAMLEAADKSGKAAILGYNYIQNPAIRHMGKLLQEGAIGEIHHVRMEMDEDFMADAGAPFTWRSEAASGYGGLDDFGVHLLAIAHDLFGPLDRVLADMSKPYATRPGTDVTGRPVENYDIVTVLARFKQGAAASLSVNRAAWGRKGRIAIQIFGSRGSILYDQERMNEFQLYLTQDRPTEQGFRTILTAPHHPPYDRFLPAPGHGLGFNDLKVIECGELIRHILGKQARVVTFRHGIAIERTVDAIARSFESGAWVSL